MPKEDVSLFFEMVAAGVKPNSDVALSERMCAYIGESGLKTNMLMVNSLVDMYMKCGATDAAKRFLMNGHCLPCQMLQQGQRPDKVTMLSAISACAQQSDSLSGKCCHGYVLRNGLEGWDTICDGMIDIYMKCGQQEMACIIFDNMSNKTVVSWNSLISGFIRSGDVKSAWEIFNEMPKSDLVSWNTMIGALVQESKFEEAIELFWVMQTEGIKGDRVTMVEVASACRYLGALDLAKWTHAYIEKKKKSTVICGLGQP
ncbi:putative pentatricopeptide [Rosa chinensis]|uniref:Putative pentatricopeptide n=1 Tax=Rosa chinensis TaxID=74649 RepID=A0A2P6RE76_ROSCH|nr:putative pentatricopeptide [Rosa chinensis]